MNRINPYRRNCEIMRKFFAKPIFLITGIVLSVYIIANTVLCLMSNQVPVFDFMSVAVCIAFFLFYFKARSKKDLVSFRAPVTLMQVVCIIGIIFFGIAILVLCATYFLMMIFRQYGNPFEEGLRLVFANVTTTVIQLMLPVLFFISILGVLFFIGMLRLTCSFSKSLSNIYLQRKGALMFGVMSLILAVVSIICFTGATTIYLFGIDEFFVSLLQGINIPTLVQGLLVTLIFVLYAILGFMYNSYIKKLVNSLETGRPVQNIPDETEEVFDNNPTLNMWAETEADGQAHRQATVTRPVEFTPQAVFGDNKPDEVVTIPTEYQPPNNDNIDNMQNPYIKKGAGATKRCANCGKENPNINIFCGNCGSRL
ncbi:zinc ribbon domain-containing protein [Ruminococcus sp.]|uniref:zinc ribbon domain-containing protein n=1 Tax=Ruminococcus sp. TaxID=41978 RepID=UPI003F0B78D4